MKNLLFVLAILSSPLAHADVLGIHDGLYRGSGTLESSSWLVPNVEFESVRRLSNGVIEAKTTATLLGMNVATAQARLQVVALGNAAFELRDLDNGGQTAGQGRCDEQGCSFAATVMHGKLTLRETWVATEQGFDVTNASQVFDGKAATYEAQFTREE